MRKYSGSKSQWNSHGKGYNYIFLLEAGDYEATLYSSLGDYRISFYFDSYIDDFPEDWNFGGEDGGGPEPPEISEIPIRIAYTYDASGNRIERTIILPPSPEERSMADTEPVVFTESLSQRTIKIYLNPTKGQLAIEISDIENIKSGNITVYNMQGKTALKQKISISKTDLDMSNHPKGIYILHINIDGKISTWKIIKE